MGAALDAVVNVWLLQDQQNYEGATAWFQPDAVITSRGVQLPGGVQEVVTYWQATHASFPDLRRDVLETVEDVDAVAIRPRQRDQHRSPVRRGWTVPATGRACQLESIDMVHLRDGKISTWHDMYDQLGLLRSWGWSDEPRGPAEGLGRRGGRRSPRRGPDGWIVIAVHSTRLGPAGGGTRMRVYPGFDDAVKDALRLSGDVREDGRGRDADGRRQGGPGRPRGAPAGLGAPRD